MEASAVDRKEEEVEATTGNGAGERRLRQTRERA